MLFSFVICFVSILIAFAAHEYSHAVMANKLGDPTPKYEGRLTLNPLVHLDLAGALVLMVSLFVSGGRVLLGWGKPVQFNSEALKDPVVDGGLVAFAGPFANLLLAVIAGLPVKLFGMYLLPELEDALTIFAGVNVALFLFNMICFPPLDGWKVLQVFLPRSLAYKMRDLEARAGLVPMYCLMACIWLGGSVFLGVPYRALMQALVGRLPLQ